MVTLRGLCQTASDNSVANQISQTLTIALHMYITVMKDTGG
jgi:hypothetical protein